MPKIKLSTKQLKRVSIVISKEIEAKKATIKNTEKQEFAVGERKEEIQMMQENDLEFLKIIKEIVDSETFGKNE